jgi:hypothetical protein
MPGRNDKCGRYFQGCGQSLMDEDCRSDTACGSAAYAESSFNRWARATLQKLGDADWNPRYDL